jgi:hypothetical protein
VAYKTPSSMSDFSNGCYQFKYPLFITADVSVNANLIHEMAEVSTNAPLRSNILK